LNCSNNHNSITDNKHNTNSLKCPYNHTTRVTSKFSINIRFHRLRPRFHTDTGNLRSRFHTDTDNLRSKFHMDNLRFRFHTDMVNRKFKWPMDTVISLKF
jgi:hypothetical protein